MKIRKYDDMKAAPAHEGSIRAHDVLPGAPDGVALPFSTAWGYLNNYGSLTSHSHPADEIYLVFKGEGTVEVGGERAAVSCGDIVEIPANAPHQIENDTDGELLWAAFWWDKQN